MSLTIDDLESSKNGPIYVLNITSGSNRSNVLFTVPKPNGAGLDTVEVPATFIPINLTEQVARRQLLISSEFRRAIARKMIELITDEEAEDRLAEDGVDEELERLSNVLNAAKSSREQTALEGAKIKDPSLSSSETDVVDTKIDGVGAGVVGYMEALKSGESDEITTLNSLRSLGVLEAADYRWVAATAEENKWVRISRWAKRTLTTL